MDIGKSPDLLGESGNWRPRKADVSFQSKSKGLRIRRADSLVLVYRLPQGEPMFPFESTGRKKASVPVQWQSGRKNSLLLRGESAFLLFPDLQLIV